MPPAKSLQEQKAPKKAPKKPTRRRAASRTKKRTTAKSPAWKQAERDRNIIRERVRGRPVMKVAEKYGVSEETVYRVMREWRQNNFETAVLGLDPLDQIAEQLARYEACFEDLAEIVEEGGKDAPVRIAAVAGKLKVLRDSQRLRQTTGILPNDLGTLSVVLDQRRTISLVIAVFEKYGVPPQAISEIRGLLPKP